ncbi:hypothetical protein IV203_017331 [Nitzschia inconspicua]|uniref:Uncharacterized protein n=1 Tax=Nitzschia inconspicua TaxID=303405 RepID=A0A9K3PJ45_9STRA|nr:hypothetical protein IV203_017331 [Nitzschia inconspicua]
MSPTREVFDGTIEKAVEEIDGVLEEMRELALLQEGQRNETIIVSETYSDSEEEEEDGERNLALELNEADESFRRRNRKREISSDEATSNTAKDETETVVVHPAETNETNEKSSSIKTYVEDIDDSPIAVTIGELSPPIASHNNATWNINPIVDPKQSLVAKENAKNSLCRKNCIRKIPLVGFCLASVGLAILVVTWLVVIRSNSSTQQQSNSSMFEPIPENHSTETSPTINSTAIPSSNPTYHPSNPTYYPSDAPSRVSRFPSVAPIVDSSLLTDLPISNTELETEWEYDQGEPEDEMNDDYYYHYHGKSPKGKGNGPAIAYRGWE